MADMTLLTLPFHGIDSVALDLGIVQIRWYGLAYLAGFLLGWMYIRRLLQTERLWQQKAPMSAEQADDMLIWIALGVILGGRIGHTVLYAPSAFLENPLSFFEVWNGGMSFHGGLLGTSLAMYLFARRNKIPLMSVGDLVAASVTIGIFFGRIANFINGELYGRASQLPWAMQFPGSNGPRHPSQLYEAGLEGLLIFAICAYLIYSRGVLRFPGFIAGAFLVLYAFARSFSEFFREPEVGHALNIGPLTAGMVYSIPMVIVGVLFIMNSLKAKRVAA